MEKLKQCLEDISSMCAFEGFQKQEYLYMIMMDCVVMEPGKAEASVASRNWQPMLTLKLFISQYFTSFIENPIQK